LREAEEVVKVVVVYYFQAAVYGYSENDLSMKLNVNRFS
jgi:hypothetical protein